MELMSIRAGSQVFSGLPVSPGWIRVMALAATGVNNSILSLSLMQAGVVGVTNGQWPALCVPTASTGLWKGSWGWETLGTSSP